MKKVLFIASTGGHLFELLELKSLFSYYDYYIVTEKTFMTRQLKQKYRDRIYYLLFGSRTHIIIYLLKFIFNFFYSFYLLLKIYPEYIVTTGAHTAISLCFIGKLFGKKIIFIESRANYTTKTLTGKLIYLIADLFIVQHESIRDLYPKSVLCLYS